MSQTIDTKVVEMRFDNSNFEANVSQSISTLDRLKASLHLGGAAKGIQNIQTAVNKVDMSPLSNAVVTVQSKFSALDAVAFSALQRITNQAMNAGENLVKSLSIDNIQAGWAKFGEKTQSVATLVAQGYGIDVVNEQLERLNWFTDETSYNFTDMVSNISKFTAAGQDLEGSVTAMEGIANWAALSGQNAATASRAMYQLSQAMGAGRMRLEDYRSIQNASMDTQEFRQHCLDAAVALGTLKKTGENTYKALGAKSEEFNINSFTSQLTKDEWLTSDVMMKVFNEYSAAVDQIYEYAEEHGITASEAIEQLGDSADAFGLKAFLAAQEARTFGDTLDSIRDAVSTGWMNIFETVFGDYSESSKLWTAMANDLYEVFATPINNIDELLSGAFDGFDAVTMDDIVNLDLDETTWTAFQKVLADTARAHGVAIDEMIEKDGSFEASLEEGWLKKGIFQEALDHVTGKDVTEKIESTTKSLGNLREIATAVIRGDYGTGQERIDKLTAAGYDATAVQNYVNTVYELTNGTWDLTDAIFEEADARAGSIESIVKMGDEELKAMGYTEEEIKSLRELAKQAEETGTPLNELYERMNRPSGRQLFAETLTASIKNLISAMGFLKDTWSVVFPPATSDQVYGIVKSLHDFVTGAKLSDANLSRLRHTLAGVLSIVDIVREAFSALGRTFGPVFTETLGKFGEGFLRVGSAIGKFFIEADRAIKESQLFDTIFQPLADDLKQVFDAASSNGDKAVSVIERFFGSLTTGIRSNNGKITDFADKVKSAFEGISRFFGDAKTFVGDGIKSMADALKEHGIIDSLKKFGATLKPLGGKMLDTVGKGLNGMLTALSKADFGNLLQIINGGLGIGLGAGLIKMLTNIKNKLTDIAGIKKSVSGIFSSLKGSIDSFTKNVKADILKKIAVSIGILAVALVALSMINVAKLGNALGAISILFGELVAATALLNKLLGGKKMAKVGGVMVAMAASVLILASALKQLSSLSWEDLSKGLVGVGAMVAMLTLVAKALSTSKGLFKGKSMMKGISQLIFMALALKMLAGVCKSLSSLSLEELGKGLAGVGGLMAEMAIFTKLTKGAKFGVSSGAGILALAAALKVLASVSTEFAGMSWEDMGQGLAGIGGLLLELGIFSKLAGNQRHMLGVGISMIAMAKALEMLNGVVSSMSGLSYEEIGRGLLAMGGALAEIALAVNLIPNNIALIAPSMVVFGAALAIIMNVMKNVGTNMDWESIGKGLTAVGGAMLILALGTNAMKGSLGGAAALMVVALAIGVLTPALKALGNMSLESILKALIAMAGAFVILGLAGMALGPMVPVLLGISAALLVLSAAIAALGGGLILIGLGIQAVVHSIAMLGQDLAQTGDVIVQSVKSMLVGIASALPEMISSLGEAIVALANVIIDSAPVIADALIALLSAAIKAAVSMAGQLAEGFLEIVIAVMEALIKYAPKIAPVIVNLIKTIVEQVKQYFPQIAKGVTDALGSLFTKIFDALKKIDTGTLLKALLGVGVIAATMLALAGLATLTPMALAGVGGLGLVIAALGGVFAALGGLAQIPGATWLIGEGGNFAATIGNALGKFIGSIVGGVAEGATNSLPKVGENLTSFMEKADPFFSGLQTIGTGAFDAVDNLAEAILKLTTADLLEGIANFLTGSSNITGFVDLLPQLATGLTSYADNLGDSLLNGDKVEASSNLALMLADLASTKIPKTGGLVQAIIGESGLDKFASALPTLADGLNAYAEKIDSTNFNSDKIEASKSLATMLSDLASAKAIKTGGLLQLLGGESDLGRFGEQLPKLADGLSQYSVKISKTNFNDDKIEASKSLASMLAVFANTEIQKTGGVLQFLQGESDLENFGNQLPKLADGLSQYASKIDKTTFNDDKIEASKNLASMLAAFAGSEVPKTGNGLLDWITGQTELERFAGQLPSLATGLSDYANKIDSASFDDDKIKASEGLAHMLASFASTEVPSSGGLFEWITGGANLDKFGEQLPKLAEGLAGFADAIAESSVTDESIGTSIDAANMLSELSTSLQGADLGGWFTSGTLEKFGGNLSNFGTKIGEYYNSISELDASKLTAINDFLSKMTELVPQMESLSQVGDNKEFTPINLTGFLGALNNLSEPINTFVEKIEKNTEEIKTASKGFVEAFVEGMEIPEGTDLSNSATTIIENLQKSLEDADLSTAATTMMEGLTSSITDKSGEIQTAGETIAKDLKTGLESNKDQIGNVFRDPLSHAVGSARDKARDANSAGSSVASNLYSGLSSKNGSIPSVFNSALSAAINNIRSYAGSAYSAAYSVGAQAAAGLSAAARQVQNAANQIVSAVQQAINYYNRLPSGGGGAAGKSGLLKSGGPGETLQKLSSELPKVTLDATKAVTKADSALNSTLKSISEAIEDKMEIEPKVKPVLDMNSVNVGVNQMQKLFSFQPGPGVLGNLGAIDTAMRGDGQNEASTTDVIDAINALRDAILDATGDTYNVNGVTYDDGSNVSSAIKQLVDAIIVERRA